MVVYPATGRPECIRMTIKTRSLTLLCLLGLVACGGTVGGDSLPRDKVDRNGLVEFGTPAGWNNEDSNSGRHFSRNDPAEDQAMIYVDALDRPPSLGVDFIWEQTKAKHEIQEQVLKGETARNANGFDLREAVYEAEVRGQNVIYHDVFLFRDKLQVQMSLNAASDVYPAYVDDFLAMVNSVRPLDAGN